MIPDREDETSKKFQSLIQESIFYTSDYPISVAYTSKRLGSKGARNYLELHEKL